MVYINLTSFHVVTKKEYDYVWAKTIRTLGNPYKWNVLQVQETYLLLCRD